MTNLRISLLFTEKYFLVFGNFFLVLGKYYLVLGKYYLVLSENLFGG